MKQLPIIVIYVGVDDTFKQDGAKKKYYVEYKGRQISDLFDSYEEVEIALQIVKSRLQESNDENG